MDTRHLGQTSALPAAPSIGRAFRELVVATRRELPFFALVAFIATLVVVRAGASLLQGRALFGLLRTSSPTLLPANWALSRSS